MKTFVSSLVVVFSSLGCTTLQPVDISAEEFQRQLVAGDLVKPGDRVRLVTADGAVHKFRVRKIDPEQQMIFGSNASVPINEIVAVETREISVGRTTALTGGVGIGIAVLIAIAIAPAAILSGG